MNCANQIDQPSLLVDRENMSISYCESTLKLQEQLGMRSRNRPFARIHQPKFRKLFDRHQVAFRH